MGHPPGQDGDAAPGHARRLALSRLRVQPRRRGPDCGGQEFAEFLLRCLKLSDPDLNARVVAAKRLDDSRAGRWQEVIAVDTHTTEYLGMAVVGRPAASSARMCSR